MSRDYRIKGRRVIAKGQKGTIGYEIEARDQALAQFGTKERREIIGIALDEVAKWWLANYLPLRFQKYAEAKLGYTVSYHWEHYKEKYMGGALPNVYKGNLRDSTLRESSEKAHTTAQSPSVTLTIATGDHNLAPTTRQVFNTIPYAEIDRISEVFGQNLDRLIHEKGTVPAGTVSIPPKQRSSYVRPQRQSKAAYSRARKA